MEEGTINEWLIEVGDSFEEGQEICEIETSKIANVLEAPFSGTLRKLLAHPGDTLAVKAPIALAAPDSVSDAELDTFAAELSGGGGSAAAEPDVVPAQESVASAPPSSTSSAVPAVTLSDEVLARMQLLEVPKWGLSMEEGTIIDWQIAEGDSFSQGQEICDIETSKIANVLEAPFDGTLRKILAHPGETLAVKAPIAICAPIDVSDEDVATYAASLGGPSLLDTSRESAPAAAPTKEQFSASSAARSTANGGLDIPVSLQSGDDDSGLHATPRARQFAQVNGINLNHVTGTGRNDRISIADIEAAITAAGGSVPAKSAIPAVAGSTASTADDSGVKATPVARRLAAKLGVNLNDCRASDSRGRVSKSDVEAAHALRQAQQQIAEIASAPVPAVQPMKQEVAGKVTAIPMSGMRKTIGARLQQSKQEAPHFRVAVDCRLDDLLALRKEVNAYHVGAKVSVNDFVLKAVAGALLKVPACNIQFDGDTIQQFEDADVAIAVALEGGLITPIVKQANRKTVVEISSEARGLITKAKANTLKPDEFQGGTFTVSNLGMFGVKHFDAIINPPQACILAVGGGEQRVIVDNGSPAVASVMTVSLTADHRVVDGAVSAQFLQAFKTLIETPILMMA